MFECNFANMPFDTEDVPLSDNAQKLLRTGKYAINKNILSDNSFSLTSNVWSPNAK